MRSSDQRIDRKRETATKIVHFNDRCLDLALPAGTSRNRAGAQSGARVSQGLFKTEKATWPLHRHGLGPRTRRVSYFIREGTPKSGGGYWACFKMARESVIRVTSPVPEEAQCRRSSGLRRNSQKNTRRNVSRTPASSPTCCHKTLDMQAGHGNCIRLYLRRTAVPRGIFPCVSPPASIGGVGEQGRGSREAVFRAKKIPDCFQSGISSLLEPGGDLLSHEETSYYHRR